MGFFIRYTVTLHITFRSIFYLLLIWPWTTFSQSSKRFPQNSILRGIIFFDKKISSKTWPVSIIRQSQPESVKLLDSKKILKTILKTFCIRNGSLDQTHDELLISTIAYGPFKLVHTFWVVQTLIGFQCTLSARYRWSLWCLFEKCNSDVQISD